MKNVILLFLLSFSLYAQDNINQFDAKGNRHGLWKGTHKETNRPRYEGVFNHGKETGVFKYFDDTKAGAIIATRDFSVGDGSCYAIFYDQKGNKVSEGKLQNKIPNGTWKYYHLESKTIMTIESYKNGKLDGTKKIFYNNSMLAEETNYSLGIKNGTAKTFAENGKPLDSHSYKNGQYQGLASYYDGNGNKMYEGNYANGKRVGLWKFFEQNKVIKEVKAAQFSKELIKYEQRNLEQVSKTEAQFKEEQQKGK
ncbi:toxin-antitoxin system YwqK family antitoxin [Flavobacterium sp.]|jgi:antitoxin component YwqK of YwqJK toxin-antitoxin module|uniref:toxin-antitoxin system YwqK family antitoxin n=1 Tax=Flavobacterium sp. TaxID=239 RepID=UPI0037BFF6E1